MRKIPTEEQISVTLDLQDERATAFGRAVCFMRQAYPNMALMTYDNRVGRGAEHLVLLKMVVGAGIGDSFRLLTYESCTDETNADNVPGGLCSRTVTTDGHQIKIEIYPAALPEEDSYSGAAALHIVSDIPGVFVSFGCGNIAFMHHSPNVVMKGEEIDCEQGSAVLSGKTVTVTRDDRDFITCVHGDMDFSICEKNPGGSYAEGKTDGCEAWLMLGFSTDGNRAEALSLLNPAEQISKVKAYYEKFFENVYINTPDSDLNGAFTHAYLNLNYSWLYPLGWIECIQHWPTMFHMEQTAAEEWAGNSKRTRETLLTQLEFITENGCIIEINPNHTARRDWGGDNHYFFREAMHYIRMTGDLDFARILEPHMEKILSQTFGEYDATDTGVLAWHSQIGNQEDFESTPGHGAAPGAVGIQMLREMSDFYNILACADNNSVYAEKSAQYRDRAEYSLKQWKKLLWKKDLGRTIWFSDDYGEKRLDTTYHGICYPIIFGQVNSFEAQSSLDHLIHRMTGKEGEVFQSNHFGDHRYEWVPTWGMQAGSNMQTVATATYAATGKHEEAIRPLDFVAKRVCGEYQRGSFPETANEKRFGYFSPSAGVFAQAVIESIFGLKRDRTSNTLQVSPCFPKDWNHAELCLPSVTYSYKKTPSGYILKLSGDESVCKKLIWHTDLLSSASVTVNGKPTESRIEYECGYCTVYANLGCGEKITVEVQAELLNITVNCPKIAVCEEKPDISVTGGKLVSVTDPCGIFDSNGCVRGDILDEYDNYGDFGLVNFARRTFAVKVETGALTVTLPVHITVIPRYLISAEWVQSDKAVRMSFTNRSSAGIDTVLRFISGGIQSTAPICVSAESEQTVLIPFDGKPVPGLNRAAIIIPGVLSREITFASPLNDSAEKLMICEADGVEYKKWREPAYFTHHGCTVINPDAFLTDVPESVEIDGLKFPLTGKFLPVSTRSDRVLTIPINKTARKLFVLFCAFADDHENCSELFDTEILCEKNDAYLPPLYKKTLYFPGDLDYGFADPVVAGFSTYHKGVIRPSALPGVDGNDYLNTDLPRYPEHSLWCRNKSAEAGNAVFNLLEFDLGKVQNIRTLTFIAKASDAAGGVFGIAVI